MKPFNVVFFLLVSLYLPTVWGQTGTVDVLVSQEGLPKADYELQIDGKNYRTDSAGFLSLDLEARKHRLSLKAKHEIIPFEVQSSQRTQLLINIYEEQVTSEIAEPQSFEKRLAVENKASGVLKLRVVAPNGRPVAGVRIFAKGLMVDSKTDAKGNAQLTLPTGEQTLSLSHSKFSTETLRNVLIQQDENISKNVELTPAGLVLEDFVVLAPSVKGSIGALIEVRRKASDVSDVMSAEQMAKTGDSDAAGSLKRVTGLTLKDGKYVYVRGLGERYSSTLLNGVALPSPDPSRRVIPLDLFPIQFLDSMVIQKSYSPEQPAEFGGGVVMLQTKSMPQKFFAKISVSQTQNSNDGELKTYQGGGSDWLGVDDGSRKLPAGALNGDASVLLDNNRHQLEDEENISLPDFSFSFGDRFDMGKLKVGYTMSGLYKDNINFTDETRGRYIKPEGILIRDENYTREKTEKERILGGIAGLQVQLFENHHLTTNYINLRNTTDYVAILEGSNAEGNTIRETNTEWAARTLDTIMLQGESRFEVLNDLTLNWQASQSNARRDEPYRTRFRYSPNQDGEFSFNPQDNTAYERRFYDLQEEANDFGLSVAMPFNWFYKRKGQISAGTVQTRKNRQSSMRRFGFNPTGESCDADLTSNLDVIFSNCADSFGMIDVTQPTDNYLASQTVNAYYFRSKWPLLASVDLSTGMRFEDSTQIVDTVSPFEKEALSSRLNTRDWLPGSALTWKMNQQMQVRLAYSETISRPDLRELSDTLWQDFETGFDVQGNPTLRATVIESYDARWEWYFTPKENLSFGLFYKDFTAPIEQVFTAGSDPRISFFNVDAAKIYGAEIEVSKSLRFLGPWFKRFSLSGNYAHILSDVSLGQIQNSESLETNRPLQGQSNYTANFLLDYEHEPYQINASLAYNVYGKRIAFTAPEGLPNVWEMPFHQLDFVISKKLTKKINAVAKIKNLLDPSIRLLQGDQVWQSWNRGQSYSFGIAMEI